MNIFAGIHIPNKPSEFYLLSIDFENNVFYLKQEIAKKVHFDANDIELIYNGSALDDDAKLSGLVRPSATVHCFRKTKKYEPYAPQPESINANAAQELFNVIAHIQVNVNSRVNILQKILAEYPEFRRNLGAQALIRDSVLFNTLHQPEVIKNVAEQYPIICEAAPYIVDVIKKELTRGTSTSNISEPATDSTNSSEEDNSLGASSSGDRVGTEARGQPSENMRIRMISRQQLQVALDQIGVRSSANSLANIAQRNTDGAATGSAPLSSSASGERISSELFRHELQRALNSLNQRDQGNSNSGNANANADTAQMDTSETLSAGIENPTNSAAAPQNSLDIGSDDIPVCYRTHQYAEQLRTMVQMGFINYEENITYLNITNGNIENAVNLLVGSMN